MYDCRLGETPVSRHEELFVTTLIKHPACDAFCLLIFNQMGHHIGNLPLVTPAGTLPILWGQVAQELVKPL